MEHTPGSSGCSLILRGLLSGSVPFQRKPSRRPNELSGPEIKGGLHVLKADPDTGRRPVAGSVCGGFAGVRPACGHQSFLDMWLSAHCRCKPRRLLDQQKRPTTRSEPASKDKTCCQGHIPPVNCISDG